MTEANTLLLSGFGYLLLFLGLAGSVLPLLPGPFLIWLGALFWAWGNGFQDLGWPTLIVMGLLTIAAWGSDLFLNTVISRRAGASWKSIGGAIVFGFIGGLLMSGYIPILGTLFGAIIGAVIGMWSVEYLDKRNVRSSFKAVRAYLVSMALSALIEITLSFIILGIFVWQAHF